MKHTKAITTQDFNKICRFCAKPSSELRPIFKSDRDDYTLLEENVSVPYLFQNTLNLDVCARVWSILYFNQYTDAIFYIFRLLSTIGYRYLFVRIAIKSLPMQTIFVNNASQQIKFYLGFMKMSPKEILAQLLVQLLMLILGKTRTKMSILHLHQ